MDSVQADLRTVLGTKNPFTLPISGTGSAGMETCLANLVGRGDRVVVGIHGVFGGRIAEGCRRLGAEVVEVRAEFGQALALDRVAEAVNQAPTRLVAFVHAETSTGVLQPLGDFGQAIRGSGALWMLDCVTSLGGMPLELDEWGVDVAFSGTQKCLSVPPGLAPLTMSERALAAAEERKPSTWYFDVGLLAGYLLPGRSGGASAPRAYHHTAPISAIFGLAAGLRRTLAEGLPARAERHREVAAALYRGLAVLGLELLVNSSLRTPMLTSVCVPEGVDEAVVRGQLRNVHRIEIGGGLGPLAGRVWRIGLMGDGAEPASVQRVLAGLGAALQQAGRSVDVAAALAAASAVASDG